MYDQEKVNRTLSESSESVLELRIRKILREYMKISSSRMAELWPRWDDIMWSYRAYKVPDRQDSEAREKKEPVKVIIPIAYAQIQTALSFMFTTFTQRDNIFEFVGRGPQSHQAAQGLEIDVAYQMQHQKFLLKAYLWMLDSLKLGFGVTQVHWKTEIEKRRVRQKINTQPFGGLGKLFGLQATTSFEESTMDIPVYEGNAIENISPYSWFPDPDFALAEFQRGCFVGHERELSLTSLIFQEGRLYHGTDKIRTKYPSATEWNYRPRRTTMRDIMPDRASFIGKDLDVTILSEVIFELNPKKFAEKVKDSTGDKVDLGDEDYPIKFIAVMANDQKIIRLERYTYLHNRFGYCITEYSPDFNCFYNPGVAGTINELQSYMSWLLNSHLANTRKCLYNQLLVSEGALVDKSDLELGRPWIRIAEGVSGSLDNVVKQVATSDITRGHISDLDTIFKFIQLVTGINDNALGQYAPGRRSATEARSVSAGAAARLKMQAQLAWYQGLEPMARQIIANTRQTRSEEYYNKILGEKAKECPFEMCILTDPDQIAGDFDIVPFDATLPSDKANQSQVLQEIFQILMQNPQSAAVFNKNPVKIIEHIMELNGINYIHDFDIKPEDLNPPAAQVVANADVQSAISQGAQPIDAMGEDLIRSMAGTAQSATGPNEPGNADNPGV